MSRVDPIVLADTITKLGPEARGAVIVSSSHGGRYAGTLALMVAPRGFVLNDAGVGRDRAGIGCLALAEQYGVAAATVAHTSCRIGEVADMWQRGTISHVNRQAAAAGLGPGESCMGAAALFSRLRPPAPFAIEKPADARNMLNEPGWKSAIVLIDSAAGVLPEDAGQIVITGSHGALVGGKATMALQVDALVAVFNDAGGGADGCGFTRLPSLDRRRIAGLTVAASSARIGEARSGYEDGIISAVNEFARGMGARVGDRLRPFVEKMARE